MVELVVRLQNLISELNEMYNSAEEFTEAQINEMNELTERTKNMAFMIKELNNKLNK